jgi:hypothetical protein
VPCPPVSEALFNFVAAWGALFLPVMLTERRSVKVGNTWAWWTGIMFVTNVFFIPFLALRAAPSTEEVTSAGDGAGDGTSAYPSWTKATAVLGLTMGLFSMWWAVGGRPEDGGDLAARWAYLTETVSSNRVFFAFVVDACLYSAWQAVLLGGVPTATPAQRYVPFFGLAAHLLTTPTSADRAAGKQQ